MNEPSFPRQYARTRRFSLGVPRNVAVAPDGERVLFLRSPGGDDPLTCLWTLDVVSGRGAPGGGPVPAGRGRRMTCHRRNGPAVSGSARAGRRDRRLRHRHRARAAGVRPLRPALGGQGRDRRGQGAGGQPSGRRPPAGPDRNPGGLCPWRRPASGRTSTAEDDRPLVEPDGPEVTYGLAEFVAAEEMGRTRGYWWSPGGDALLVARVDTSPVDRWYIADPAHPDRVPRQVPIRPPERPTPTCRCGLVGLDGSRRQVEWDRAGFEYLVDRPLGGDRPAGRGAEPGPAPHADPRGRPGHGGRPGCGARTTTPCSSTSWPGRPGSPRTAAWCGRPTRTTPAVCSSATRWSPPRGCRSARCWTWTATPSCLPPPRTRPRSTCGPRRRPASSG